MRQSTASAPSSAACWKAAWKAPGEGAAVSGRSPLPRQRSQNSAGVSWRRSSSSSSPKRMVSGTTMTLCSLTSWSVRSQALSVTMWTPGMQGVCHGAGPSRRGGRARPGGGRGRHARVAPGGTRRPSRVLATGPPGRRAVGGAGAASWRRPEPDHDGAEGEAAGDARSRRPGPGGRRCWSTPRGSTPPARRRPWARRPRRRGQRGPRRPVGQAPEPLAEDGERQQGGHGVGDRQRQGEAAHAEGVDQQRGPARC